MQLSLECKSHFDDMRVQAKPIKVNKSDLLKQILS